MTKEERRKKKVLHPEFLRTLKCLYVTQSNFSLVYILIMIVEDTCGTTMWNVASETFQSHAWKPSLADLKHEDVFSLRNTFFLIFYTVLSITRLLHEKAHKKSSRGIWQLRSSLRSQINHGLLSWNNTPTCVLAFVSRFSPLTHQIQILPWHLFPSQALIVIA